MRSLCPSDNVECFSCGYGSLCKRPVTSARRRTKTLRLFSTGKIFRALKIFPVEKRRKVFVRRRAEVTGRLQSDPYPHEKHSTLSLGHKLLIVPPKHPDDTLKMATPRGEAPFHLADFTTPADVLGFGSVPQPQTAFLPCDNPSLAEGLIPFHTFLSFIFILCQKRAITGRMEAFSKHHAGPYFLPCPSPGESSPGIPAGMRCVRCWSHEGRRHGKIL